MTITVDSPFVSAPRISRERFVAVLDEAGSPWAAHGAALYDLIAGNGHDPAVWLAIAGREHGYGTNRDSVLWRNGTNSWTNARTVRDPSLSNWSIIVDPVRKSEYVRYASVADSLRDGMYRVTDPTYRYVKEGRTTIGQVLGIWTEDPGPYTQYVIDRMNEWEPSMAAQIPGFAWLPADRRHYTPGRRQRISGFAVHYTGGIDSRAWLTTSPNSDVSATFLIRHNPTLADRGWQLVRIEDTAHTTGPVVNPKTVSFEYEQMEGQPIPDIAYDVMAQTILDASRYVAEHDLGAIPLTRQAIKGHKEWVGDDRVCPDGISVDRVARRAVELAAGSPPKPPALVTVPDPWKSPFGSFWIPKAFIADIDEGRWMDVGYCLGGATTEGGAVVQYFERARLELWPDGRVTRGRVGAELLACRAERDE